MTTAYARSRPTGPSDDPRNAAIVLSGRDRTTSEAAPQPTHFRALRNMRIHGLSSPQPSGYHDCCTVRKTRSAWGIRMVKRPSFVVRPVMPPGDPFGFKG